MREGRPKQTDGKTIDKKADVDEQNGGKEYGHARAKDSLVIHQVEEEISQLEASSESESEDDGEQYSNPFSALC